MKNLTLSIKDRLALTISIIVLTMNLNLHAKNMLLKPAQLPHSLGHILGHKLATWHTRTSISHESIGTNETNRSWSWLVLLHIELLNLV
jgi:hypothetical protein